jgi:IS605 OrfB family transposase
VFKKAQKDNIPQMTIVCKMSCSPEADAALRNTAVAFARGAQLALDCAEKAKSSGKAKVQKICYREVRAFGLSANLAVRAIARACEARRSAKVKHRQVKAFRPTSVSYDARIFSLCKNGKVSLTTVAGRLRIPLDLGKYQRDALAGKRSTSAVLYARKGGWYIHIVVDAPSPKFKEVTSSLGVDRGVYNTAVLSTGRFFSGREAMHRRERYASRRRSLQALGTKGAKRALRRLGHREHLWMRDVNHCVSKAIVKEAVEHNAAIVFENLKGIRNRTRRFSKVWRRKVNAWAFAELETFSKYKADAKGIPVVFVEAAYSSRTCPRCGVEDKRSRKGAHFECVACGYRLAADLAASRTVAGRHACPARAVVIQPMASTASHASDASPAL